MFLKTVYAGINLAVLSEIYSLGAMQQNIKWTELRKSYTTFPLSKEISWTFILCKTLTFVCKYQ